MGSVLIAKQCDMIPKLLSKGAILNSKEIPVLIDAYLYICCIKQLGDSFDALATLDKLIEQCDINIKYLANKHGNNSLNLFLLIYNMVIVIIR